MKLGVGIPQSFPSGVVDVDSIRRYLVRAESLGFDSVWTQEQILGRMPTLEPLTLMNYAAACTTRVRLGCAVFLTTLRSPVHMAKMLTTLDHLSGGRLDVGVGLGAARADAAFGVDPTTRVARFTEGLQLMKALWSEPEVTFGGRFWQLDHAAMEPKPVQRPHPPIWFGASHPDALRRSVRLGDAFIGAGSTPSEQFAEQVKLLRRYLDEAGRDPATFPIAKRVYLGIDENKDRAGARLAEWFTLNYGRSSNHERVTVWGPPDECAERLRSIVGSGAEMLVLTTLYDEAEQLERIAEVAPMLES